MDQIPVTTCFHCVPVDRVEAPVQSFTGHSVCLCFIGILAKVCDRVCCRHRLSKTVLINHERIYSPVYSITAWVFRE